MPKFVVFANQKGGCGKSTALTIYAAFLAKHKEKKMFVLDSDRQRTLYRFYQQETKTFNQNALYIVEPMQTLDIYNFILEKKKNTEDDTIYFIDTPNQLNTENFKLFTLADYIVVPFNYSPASFASTNTFCTICLAAKGEDDKPMYDCSKIFFFGNAIKSSVRQDTLNQFKEGLREKLPLPSNVLDADFRDTIEAARIEYLNVSDSVIELFKEPLDELYNKMKL